MELYDRKAVEILFAAYWKNGYGWLRTPPSQEDFEYAVEKGVMFREGSVAHDDMITRIIAARERVSPDKCAAAFLCSLSTRQLYLLSAVVSRFMADSVQPHEWQAKRVKTRCDHCSECGFEIVHDHGREINEYNFERFKFGGVVFNDLYYCLLDLETFPVNAEFVPTDEDIRIFREIIDTADSCEPNDASSQLCKKLSGVFKSNKDERSGVIEILGFLGILKAACERPERGSKNDWDSTKNWRGEDGVNREAVDRIFGKYL